MIRIGYEIAGAQATLMRFRKFERVLPAVLGQAIHREALHLSAMIKTGIQTGAPGGKPLVPNAPLTIRLKRSSKPLIDHGDLVRSIGVTSISDTEYFVGVNRAARGRGDRQPLATIAEWMEEGTRAHVIPVTPKSRAFLRHHGIIVPRNRTWIMHPGTPPRPFLRPTVEQWARNVHRRLREDITRRLAQELPGTITGDVTEGGG